MDEEKQPASGAAQKSERVGLVCVFCAAVLFSIGGLFIKSVPWSPLAINGARNVFSSLVLIAYVALKRHKLRFNLPIALGALSMAGTSVSFVFATKLTTAANAIVLQFTAPVYIILLLWMIFREKPKKLDVVACLLVFAGIVCFFVDSLSAGGMLGNVIALLSGIAYAGVFMMNRSKNSDPLSSVLFGHITGAVIGVPFVFFETEFTPQSVGCIILLGVFQLGLAYILFSAGIKRTSPVAASLVAGIEPILNPVWVAIFNGETISGLAFFGAAIVLVSLVGYNYIKAKYPNLNK